MLNETNSLLLIIDIQEKLINSTYNKSSLEKQAKIICKTAETLNLPVFVTEQYPKGLGKTILELNENTKYFEKITFSALDNDYIKQNLVEINKKNIILIGIETHICVYQTACALQNCGYNVTVVMDACGSRSEIEHKEAINNFRQLGIEVKTTEMIIFELLKTANHPKFKEIQSLIK